MNLLAAIGEKPYMSRPNFPIPADSHEINIPYHLERCNQRQMARWVLVEKPDYIKDTVFLEKIIKENGCQHSICALNHFDAPHAPAPTLDYSSIQDLYAAVTAAFEGGIPADELFRGNTQRQVTTAAVQLEGNVTMQPVITISDAVNAINLIISQGEGIGLEPSSPDSHFARFSGVLQSMRADQEKHLGDPALPALCDPMVVWGGFEGAEYCNLVTEDFPADMMRLFNEGYYLMVLLLRYFFQTYRGNWGTYPAFKGMNQNMAAFEVGFFPFMTMFIRPLGEMLMRIPAGENHPGHTAGPSFQLPVNEKGVVDVPPYDPKADHLELFSKMFNRLKIESFKLSEQVCNPKAPGYVPDRFFKGNNPAAFLTRENACQQLTYLYQNLTRMSTNMTDYWTQGGTNAPF